MKRFASLVLLVFPLGLARAQTLENVELVRARIVVSEGDARTKCTAVPHRDPYITPAVSLGCRVVSFDTLSSSGERRWKYVVQRHTSIYNFSDSVGVAKRDTIIEIETIVFSARNPRALVAVLHSRKEETLIRSITPDVSDRGGRDALFSIEFCVNGTGGCWQEFWLLDWEGWYKIPDPLPEIHERVLHSFSGDSSHQTRPPRVNVKTLRGTAAIAARGDANCCPSHRAEFHLALDRALFQFRVLEFRVVANDR